MEINKAIWYKMNCSAIVYISTLFFALYSMIPFGVCYFCSVFLSLSSFSISLLCLILYETARNTKALSYVMFMRKARLARSFAVYQTECHEWRKSRPKNKKEIKQYFRFHSFNGLVLSQIIGFLFSNPEVYEYEWNSMLHITKKWEKVVIKTLAWWSSGAKGRRLAVKCTVVQQTTARH